MGGALTQLTILAMKLALPIVGLLILLDLAMALMNRIHSHLNLISITFPAKMLLTLAVAAHLLGGWSVLVQKEGASWAKQVAAAVLAEEQGGR
jgi:flagellar biosynthetic protein FliR